MIATGNNFILKEVPSSSLLSYQQNRSTTIFLGSNFLFSNRLYLNFKRSQPVVSQEIKLDLHAYNVMPFCLEELFALIRFRNADTLLFTSELFLLLDTRLLESFASSLCAFRKQYTLKIVFCQIKYPFPMDMSSATCDKNSAEAVIHSWREIQSHNSFIRANLIIHTDLVFEFSSYLSSGFNPFQGSFFQFHNTSAIAEAFKVFGIDDQIRFFSAEDLSILLLEFLSSHGSLCVDDTESSVSLSDLVSIRIGHHDIRNLLPIINDKGLMSTTVLPIPKPLIAAFSQTYCSLEIIYRSPPESVPFFSDKIVASTRIKLGERLSISIPSSIKDKLDFICPIPETGKYYAQGLANSLQLPYIEAIIKARDIGRSFDIQNSSSRKDFILEKLAAMPDLLEDKVVGFVDEAIFTGSTLKIVSDLASRCKVKEIYFLIPTPECKQRCIFNMHPDRNILSEYVRAESLPIYFDVDGVFFQNQDVFSSTISEDHGPLCSFCFS